MTKIKNGKWLAIAVLAVLLVLSTVLALLHPAGAGVAATVEPGKVEFVMTSTDVKRDETEGEHRAQWKATEDGEYYLDVDMLKNSNKVANGFTVYEDPLMPYKSSWDFSRTEYPTATFEIKFNNTTESYVSFSYFYGYVKSNKSYTGQNTQGKQQTVWEKSYESWSCMAYVDTGGTSDFSNLNQGTPSFNPTFKDDNGEAEELQEVWRDVKFALKPGEHTIKVVFKMTGTNYYISDKFELRFKDVNISTEPFDISDKVTVDYNSHLADLYIWEESEDGSTIETKVDKGLGAVKDSYTFEIKYAKQYSFGLKVREDVDSAVWEGQKAVIDVDSSYTPAMNFTKPTSFSVNTSVVGLYMYGSDKVLLNGSSKYDLVNTKDLDEKKFTAYFTPGTEEGLHFDYITGKGKNGTYSKFREKIDSKPTLTVTRNGVDAEEEIGSSTKKTIVFPAYATGTNRLAIKFEDGKLLSGTWSVIVDGTNYSNDIFSAAGKSVIMLDDVRDHIITVGSTLNESYLINDGDQYTIRVYEEIQNDKGILNAVVRGNFADQLNTDVEDGIAVRTLSYGEPMYVNQALSTEGGPYAYRSNASYKVGEVGGARFSLLGFDFTNQKEAGVFSFDFRIRGTYQGKLIGYTYGVCAAYFFDNLSSRGILNSNAVISNGDGLLDKNQGSDRAFTSSKNHNDGTGGLMLQKLARSEASGMSYGTENVTVIGEWAHFSIRINPEEMQYKVLHLAIACSHGGDTSAEQSFDIKNISFVPSSTGNANVAVKLSTGKGKVTATPSGQDAKVLQDSADPLNFEMPLGNVLQLEAESTSDEHFYGWYVNGTLISKAASFSYVIEDENVELLAEFQREGYYTVQANGKMYQTLQEALEEVGQGEIYFLCDVTLTGKITIPKNISLVLPIDDIGTYRQQGDSGNITTIPSWLTSGGEAKYRYLTVTFDENAIVTIEGNLYVGGVVCYPYTQAFQGHTSGTYSHLVNNGQITVADGGVLDVFGRVTGKGKINVLSGATMLEPFLILDYAGGMNALSSFNLEHTPFKRYAMNNVECEFTINYGAHLVGHATLFALSSLVSLDQPFIGSDKDGAGRAMVMLKEGASVTMTYDPDKVVGHEESGNENCVEGVGQITMNFKGGATFSYMVFSAFGISIPTYTVYFSIPYNYNVIMSDGDYETITDFMLMPGSRVEVAQSATLTTNASVWIFDGLTAGASAGKSYPTANELTKAGYTKNANLIVNGTLKIGQKIDMGKFVVDLNGGGGIPSVDLTKSKKVPATFLGVVQTDGTGKIEILANTVLSGTIADGISGQNWFEYNTTARVWDKAHSCFANLTCEQEEVADGAAPTKWTKYVAKSNVTFTVGSIEYAGTKGGKAQTMELNQELHGSWMIEHEHHSYVWTPQDGDNFGELSQDNLHKQLTRYCTELGCEEFEHKELLYAGVLGSLEYNGKDVTEEQLRELFKQLYTEGIEVQTVEISGTAHNAQDGYKVTITLSKDFWLDGEQYVATKELTFNVTKKTITVTAQDQESVYGDKYTIGQTKYDAPELCEGDSLELTIQVQGGADTTNHGEYTLEIVVGTGASNANYNIQPATGTYTVKQRDITVNLPSFSRAYNGKVAAASELGAAVLADGSNLASGDSLEKLVAVSVENAGKDVKAYAVKGSAQAGSDNYNIKFVDGSFVITKVTLTVTAQNCTSVFGQELQALDYDVVGLVNNETKEDVLAPFVKISTNATQGSPVGTGYVITVEWKDDGRPVNYDANFVTGTYTITEAAFAGISLENVTVTYDGETHTLQVKGAPHDAQVVYKLKDQSQVFAGAKNVGKYEVEATVSLANYKSQTFNATLEITVRNITVDLPTFSRDYNGQVPQAGELSATLHQGSTLGKGDQLANIVTLSIEGAAKDAKTYTVTGTQKADATNYKVSFGANGSYTVKPAKLTVTIQPQNKEYDGKDGSIENVANKSWVVSTGKVVDGDALPVVLTLVSQSDNKHAGKYTINGECSDNNYEVTFEGGTDAYTITKKALKVTAHNQTSTYGDEPVAVGAAETYTVEGWIETAPLTVNISHSVTKTSGFKADGYEITVNVPEQPALANYDVTTENGLYTVSKRNVSVTINDQHDTFGFGKEYAWSGDAWTVDEETLAEGETRVDLKVSLAKPQFNGANEYTITGSSANENYNVSFTDGTYTLAKKTIDHDGETVVFTLLVNDDGFNESNPELYVWEGEPIPLAAQVMVKEDSFKELAYTLSVQQLDEVGVFQVVVTIQDDNYQGSHTYTVEVVAEDGFTQNLRNVLAALEEIVGDVTESTLKSTNEHFEMLQKVQQELNKLNDDEKQVGAEKLAVYTALVAAWNDAADLSDNVITTAKTLADAPIKWLFAVAELNALLGALFVLGKGGRV